MKKLVLSLFALALGVGLVFGANGKKTIPLALDISPGKVTNTFANSQVDTVIFNREASLSSLAFAMHGKDSFQVLTIKVRRVVDGALMAQVASDTLDRAVFTSTTDGSAGSTTFSDGSSATATVTLTPLCDQFLFIVTYASSGNGVTTPTVVYEAVKQYSRR